jgi:hypothetical protein
MDLDRRARAAQIEAERLCAQLRLSIDRAKALRVTFERSDAFIEQTLAKARDLPKQGE